MIRCAPPLAFALLLASGAPALAEGQWGALALSERSTAYGYAFDHETQETAAARALSECARNAQDCRVHTTFRNTCLVLAGSVDGPFGWAWGARQQTREQRALEQCRQRGAVNCKIVERVCSGTAGGPRTPQGPARAPDRPATPNTPAATTAPNTPPNARTPGAPTKLHQ